MIHWLCILVSLAALGNVAAQTNFFAWSLIDTLPISGTADTLATGLIVGQINEPGSALNGLSRAELIVRLPAMPPSSVISSAVLGIHLQQNTGTTNGNPTFGPLNVYHRYSDSSVVFDTDYADPRFSFVTNVITPSSATGQYYYMDVTAQINADYDAGFASDNPSPHAKFRFQVDDIQYLGGTHSYEFYFASVASVFPVIFNVTFAPAPPPRLDVLAAAEATAIDVLWHARYSDFRIETKGPLPTSKWTALTNTPFVQGGRQHILLTNNVLLQLLRLRQL